MKLNRVKKICEICNKSFDVIKCRENSAKFCSRNCYDKFQTKKIPWNKGKTWNEIFGEDKADELKNLFKKYFSGEKNPMFGHHHSDSSKYKMSQLKQGYIPWNTGKKFPGMFNHVNRLGENNAYIKYVLKEENITYNEYLSRLTDKEKYYKAVIRITRLQNINILENYDKRAKAPEENAYHLDHIYPVSMGFHNNIPPEIIGDISNLRFIHWKENLKKSDKLLDIVKTELYENRISN